ncbi:hypothetical protein [Streptomyces typhae]|uniref:hypothetical protein n=1 Tax=Streptomyces typhae TaxID=2681492 RepID=UPI0012F6ACA9|nr:hypothetical protein [Streptomyces typhae]
MSSGDVIEYRAEAVGTGLAGGQQVRVVLGTLATPYLGITMRWVGTQAHRIADALDPEPCAPWLADAPDALVKLDLPEWAPDVPTELRAWCADKERRRAARDRLRAGRPFALSAVDHSGTYCVWVVPVDVPASHTADLPVSGRFEQDDRPLIGGGNQQSWRGQFACRATMLSLPHHPAAASEQ